MFKYPGTQHGFNNDTTPRYEEAAAAGLAADDRFLQEESHVVTAAAIRYLLGQIAAIANSTPADSR